MVKWSRKVSCRGQVHTSACLERSDDKSGVFIRQFAPTRSRGLRLKFEALYGLDCT